MTENSSDKSQDDNSEVSEFKDESFGVNVGKLAGDLAKQSDRETASNVDKQNQEPKAEVAEVAELDVSTEANNRQLTHFINRHGFIYTILCPQLLRGPMEEFRRSADRRRRSQHAAWDLTIDHI